MNDDQPGGHYGIRTLDLRQRGCDGEKVLVAVVELQCLLSLSNSVRVHYLGSF